MQFKKMRRVLSIFSAAALMATQLTAIAPEISAEGEAAQGAPKAAPTEWFTDDFENRNELSYKANTTDNIDKCIFKIENESVEATNKVLKIQKSESITNEPVIFYYPQLPDGSLAKVGEDNGTIVEGKTYRYIVEYKLKVISQVGQYAVYVNTGVANKDGTDLKNSTAAYIHSDSADTSKIGTWGDFQTYAPVGGDWQTVSFATSYTSTDNLTEPVISLSFKYCKVFVGEILIDDIKVSRVAEGDTAATVIFNTGSSQKLNPVSYVAGAQYSFPTLNREGYVFGGYTANNQAVTNVFPENSADKNYVILNANWEQNVTEDFETNTLGSEALKILSNENNLLSIETDKNNNKFLHYKSEANTNVPLYFAGIKNVVNGTKYQVVLEMDYKINTCGEYDRYGLEVTIDGFTPGPYNASYHTMSCEKNLYFANYTNDGAYYLSNCLNGVKNGEWNHLSVAYDATCTGSINNPYYLFWFKNGGRTGIDVSFDNIKIRVVENKTPSNVIVETNGGTEIRHQGGLVGEEMNLPTTTKNGYTFGGWYTDAELTQEFDGKFPVNTLESVNNGNTRMYSKIYAKWVMESREVLHEDFESNTLDTSNADAAKIVDGAGKNGGKALVITADGSLNEFSVMPKNSDGTPLSITANSNNKFIVKLTYKLTQTGASKLNQYNPIWVKPQLGNSATEWKDVFGANFHLGECMGDSRIPYTVAHMGYCGYNALDEWHTVSYPLSSASTINSNFMLGFAGISGNGQLIIDDISITRIDENLSTSTVVFKNTELEYRTYVTGENASVLPVPTKEGFSFGGWYTDEALTKQCLTIPANDQSQTEDGKTTENVYVNLYAKWVKLAAVQYDTNGDSVIDIRDLVHMKKSIAAGENKYNADSLAALRSLLLSDLPTEVTKGSNTYALAMYDEFDGNAINSSLWNVTNTQNVEVENGVAKFGSSNGAGEITTANKLNFKYGYIEARVKLPETKKLKGAFWLNQNYSTDLYFSEIDIFENFGESKLVSNVHKWDNRYKKNNYATTAEELLFHTDFAASVLNNADKAAREKKVDSTKFYTIGCEWGEDFVKFYLDGTCYLTVDRATYGDAADILNASPLYIVLGSGGTDENARPTYSYDDKDAMQVDYIRLYQNSSCELIK